MVKLFGFGTPKCAHCKMELGASAVEKDGKKFCCGNCQSSFSSKGNEFHKPKGGSCCH